LSALVRTAAAGSESTRRTILQGSLARGHGLDELPHIVVGQPRSRHEERCSIPVGICVDADLNRLF
jgi:hypothetical protein